MKSVNQVKKIAKTLGYLSIDDKGKIDQKAVKIILSLIHENKLYKLGILIEEIQLITLLKMYETIVRNLITADSFHVTTSYQLSDSEKQELEKSIMKIFQKDSFAYSIDKAIIAGIRLRSGWDIIDASLHHTLDTLT